MRHFFQDAPGAVVIKDSGWRFGCQALCGSVAWASITTSLGSKNRPGYNIPSSVGSYCELSIALPHPRAQSPIIVMYPTLPK